MTTDNDIAKIAERLRGTTKEDWDDGLYWGQQWASHDATLSQLRQVYDRWSAGEVDEDALVEIDPALPESLNGGDDPNLSRRLGDRAFVGGFAEGAKSVLDKVMDADPTIADA